MNWQVSRVPARRGRRAVVRRERCNGGAPPGFGLDRPPGAGVSWPQVVVVVVVIVCAVVLKASGMPVDQAARFLVQVGTLAGMVVRYRAPLLSAAAALARHGCRFVARVRARSPWRLRPAGEGLR